MINIGITDGVWTALVGAEIPDGTPLVTRQDRDRTRRGFRFF